jgi:hypothetical protein
MTKKKEVVLPPVEVAEEAVEEVAEPEPESTADDDDDIQAPPPVKTVKPKKKNGTFIVDPYNVKPKPKRVQSEKQKENFQKMVDARNAKIEVIRAEKARLMAEDKVKTEERIVKKAVSIQKKKLKKEKVIEEVSDDDDDVEEVRKTVKARRVIKEVEYLPAPAPAFNFL